MKRIALSGKPLAGKTTLSRLLVEKYGYRHASLSDVIVEELANASWMQDEYGRQQVTAAEIYENKELWRQELQSLGDSMGFQYPERVVGIMQKALQHCGAWGNPGEPVVLESIRGEVQASAARALGFTVINLWVDEQTQQLRAGSLEAYHRLRNASRARPDLESGVESASIRLTQEMSLESQAEVLYNLREEGLSNGPANQPFKPGSLAAWEGC